MFEFAIDPGEVIDHSGVAGVSVVEALVVAGGLLDFARVDDAQGQGVAAVAVEPDDLDECVTRPGKAFAIGQDIGLGDVSVGTLGLLPMQFGGKFDLSLRRGGVVLDGTVSAASSI